MLLPAMRAALVALVILPAAPACQRQTSSTAGSVPGEPPPDLVALVRTQAHRITGTADYDPLLAMIGDAHFVLLGEATHGTREFYQERLRITQRLIREKGFTGIAIEGDWPDTDRVNRYVRAIGTDRSAEEALTDYAKFPVWMWRNHEVLALVRWLRAYNDSQPPERDVGAYGLDVYSLFTSADAVIRYLADVDPAAADRARKRYACFERYRDDPQHYGMAAATGKSCTAQVIEERREIEERARTMPADPVKAEALFGAVRNAYAVANAEEYFRTLYEGGTSTWNLRDQRMAETLDALAGHLDRVSSLAPRIAVWAHNTHAGDARVTQVGDEGEHNVGQLMRQRHDGDAVLVGFLTYTGTVRAAPDWDRPDRDFDVRPSLPESFGALFHATGIPAFLLVNRGGGELATGLSESRLERAIGVVYKPETERLSHYFMAKLARQFDAVVFLDTTHAVVPLPR